MTFWCLRISLFSIDTFPALYGVLCHEIIVSSFQISFSWLTFICLTTIFSDTVKGNVTLCLQVGSTFRDTWCESIPMDPRNPPLSWDLQLMSWMFSTSVLKILMRIKGEELTLSLFRGFCSLGPNLCVLEFSFTHSFLDFLLEIEHLLLTDTFGVSSNAKYGLFLRSALSCYIRANYYLTLLVFSTTPTTLRTTVSN